MPSLVIGTGPPPVPLIGEFELAATPLVIGRTAASGCHVVLRGDAVSRTHARVAGDAGRFLVADLGSRNGTYLNGQKLPAGAAVALRPGDRIGIGVWTLRYHDNDIPAASIDITQAVLSAPADRLRSLIAVCTAAARDAALNPLYSQIAEVHFGGRLLLQIDHLADTLLDVFAHAGRCVLLVLDEAGRPVPQVVKTRGAADDGRFCRTLALAAVATRRACVATTTADPAWPPPRSVICVPLADSDGSPLGALQLESRDHATPFGADELGLMTAVADLVGVALERARAFDTVQSRDKEQRELKLAWEVQSRFLPRGLPEVLGYEFYAHYLPAKAVGGDYYDFVALPGGRVAVVVADVSGKGVPAALLVAKLSSEVRFCLLTAPDLAHAIRLLNAQLIAGGLGDRFITLVAMVLDPAEHTLTVANAGHPTPKVFRAATRELGDAISVEASGPPLGVEPDYPYEAVTLALGPDDTVTAFSDGVTEAMNAQEQLFGLDAVARHLVPEPAAGAPAGRPCWVGAGLITAVRKHAGGRAQNDDIVLVSFGRCARWEADSDQETTHTL